MSLIFWGDRLCGVLRWLALGVKALANGGSFRRAKLSCLRAIKVIAGKDCLLSSLRTIKVIARNQLAHHHWFNRAAHTGAGKETLCSN